MYIAASLLILSVLYILALRGRRGHPGMDALRGWSYAHRGLHKEGVPENSIAAFRAALDAGYGIELDVHLLADGNLAVFHDHNLQRITGADVKIETLTTDQLRQYRLNNTHEVIPDFREVLDLFDGKAPMIVELKSTADNYAALTDKAVAMLQNYSGPYCIESFDPRCIFHLKKHYPRIIRGQLVENFTKSKAPIPWLLKLMLTLQLENFLITPDFIAHSYPNRKNPGNFLARRLWGVQGVSWTVPDKDIYDAVTKEGYLPIFEGFEP